jgi:hypothetical protein
MNTNCENKTTAHIQNILYVDDLHKLKERNTNFLCRIGIRQSHLRQNGHGFFYIELVIFSLFAMQLDYCNIQCLIKSRNSHCLYAHKLYFNA